MDCDIASYHVDSFNFLADHGLQLAATSLCPEKLRVGDDAVEISFSAASLARPTVDDVGNPQSQRSSNSLLPSSCDSVLRLFPSECRQRALSYSGRLKVVIEVRVNGRRIEQTEKAVGFVPIMLCSGRCNLNGLSRSQLVQRGEEANEQGGYFICKGGEKVVRLLVANRRNYPIAIVRPRYRDRGKLYTQYGVMMRSIKDNHTVTMMTVHYLDSCTMNICIQYNRELFFIPLIYILKALTTMNDYRIQQTLVRLRPGDNFWRNCIVNMLIAAQQDGVTHQESALRAIGSRFRVFDSKKIAPWDSDAAVGKFVMDRCVAIHVDSHTDKFNVLAFMAEKLIGLVKGEYAPESLDNPQFQEASVSGNILLMLIRERLDLCLRAIRNAIEQAHARTPDNYTVNSATIAKALHTALRVGDVTRSLEYFLATGSLQSISGLGLQQNNGFTVIAERINYLRFVSHFRAIHRGAYFTEMRTTDVRKLRPEAWGFICPVHTPDGSPCGLLNHVTASTRIVTHYSSTKHLVPFLSELGMLSHSNAELLPPDVPLYPVLVDGAFVGYLLRDQAVAIERQLRFAKVNEKDTRVPSMAEITLIRHSPDRQNILVQHPGLYVFTHPGRLMRPVTNLAAATTEFIGTFEQVYLSVCIDASEAEPGVTAHQEISPCCQFSFAGNLIPFPDHNQSPRNVYQCQMGKQTMGTAVHSWHARADSKMYRLQFPQNPLLKTEAYDRYGMDEYPLGTNAVVAVISYTGYDMEDAMVINRGSYQRGFGHGTVIKVERIDLVGEQRKNEHFSRDPIKHFPGLDANGLPIPGRLYRDGDVYAGTVDRDTGCYRTCKFKSAEPAFCGLVRIVANRDGSDYLQHVLIQWRICRNPIIGDKFASRHGQKGINSFLWPVESMPFTESGMVPDILFNPHGFPSRMTIGMMIESMAGKAAAMHATTYDATPFVFNEKKTAIAHFGQLLTKAGFNYYGNEVMYSGVDGRELQVEIFMGVVYYQRLRHMIADKYQVRATGPVDPVTQQPVKGRKRAGGVRFGEMERDALIAHGAAFCLQDRLLNCSDRDCVQACTRCESIVSVMRGTPPYRKMDTELVDHTERDYCRSCGRDESVKTVQVPHVFRCLAVELAAMNIRLEVDIKHPSMIKR